MTIRFRAAACCFVLCVACPAAGRAQIDEGPTPAAVAPTALQPWPAGATRPVPPVVGSERRRHITGGFWAPFTTFPVDVVRLFSADTLSIATFGSAAALAAHPWDGRTTNGSQQLPSRLFAAGNIGGGFLAQTSASVGLYSIARLTGSGDLAALGADLVRAQILTQGIVQAAKVSTRRQRPDNSDQYALPSGHAAAAFATASVLEHHVGWKAAIPAYGFGTYVAVSRMSANKHHLSDVLLGAAVGIAAGRTVTVGAGRARFAVGAVPTPGGAALTLTKR